MEEIKNCLQSAVQEQFGVEIVPEVSVAPENTGADYASNVALRLAKLVKQSPLAIAEQLKGALEAREGWTLEVQVSAPGFLNFISPYEYFAGKIAKFADNLPEALENISQGEYTGKTVVAEFSDPNPFKVLHVGHLYTSVVGDSIARLLEFAGAKVVRANFGGDVGLHVGKTLWAAKRHYQPADLTIERLAQCYVEGTQAYEEDEQAKAEIAALNQQVYKIVEQDERTGELAELYWRGRELSYQYFAEFYARIGLEFDRYYPESSVAGRGLKEVREHVPAVYEESNGAIVYRGEKVGLHTRVFINQMGIPTYEAKDVGLLFTKWDDWHFDESVVITGNEIIEYMKVVLASVREYAPELVERTTHLTHGMVKLPGSVKMSSRKGNFLKAVDVLEMVGGLLEQEGRAADARVVLAAIKYAFLKYKVGGDLVFDPEESVSMTGNSGVYLLYSAVRAKKILSKQSAERTDDTTEVTTWERGLSKKIVQYAEVLAEAVREKAPYKICTYLYEVAQEFSRFYEHAPVAGSAREAERRTLVRAYLAVMEHGLGLLGIEAPEAM